MLSDKITIGHSSQCDIVLGAPTISGTHASVSFTNGNLYWFEFSYPYSQLEVYDKYINDIYGSFSY